MQTSEVGKSNVAPAQVMTDSRDAAAGQLLVNCDIIPSASTVAHDLPARDAMTPEKLFALVAGESCAAVLLTLPGGDSAVRWGSGRAEQGPAISTRCPESHSERICVTLMRAVKT